jgi:hypothetical protein
MLCMSRDIVCVEKRHRQRESMEQNTQKKGNDVTESRCSKFDGLCDQNFLLVWVKKKAFSTSLYVSHNDVDYYVVIDM